MNLNEEPTGAQLRQIISPCDDNLNHVLWVNKEGYVGIQALGLNESPALWAMNNRNEIQFRCEIIPAGEEKVGRKALSNKKWMATLFSTLIIHWEKKTSGFAGFRESY